MKRQWWSPLLAGLLPLLTNANEIPEAIIPNGVGVNIHFVTGHEKDLDLIAAAGFRFVRMDFGWAATERQKGNYNWSEYDQLLAHLEQRGIRAVLILDYSNPLYEEEVTSTNPLTHQSHQTIASPQHAQSVLAYATWAATAAKHFQGRHILWELWNEPNIDFWSPKPDVQQYITMALAAAKQIRENDAQATIVGPATSGFPWEFLERFMQSGILEYLDAVSVHPYREPKSSPETASLDYQRLRSLIDRYAPADKKAKLPILSGEWGYSSWRRGVSTNTQAAFLVRQQLVNLLNSVPLSIWYDWKNDGTDLNENEHNFGTVDAELALKPAYLAVHTFTHALTGFSIARRYPVESEDDYVLVCSNRAGAQILAAWTTGQPHLVSLPLASDAKILSGTLATGEKFTPKTQRGQCELSLSDAPMYISFRNPAIK